MGVKEAFHLVEKIVFEPFSYVTDSKEKVDNHVIRFYKNNKINFSTSLKTWSKGDGS